MNSILPSNQNACPSCGTFNPADALVCEGCGAKLDVPREGLSFNSGIHLLVSFCIIFSGVAGFLHNYPPGRIINTINGYYQTDSEDILIWGILPLVLGILYLLFAFTLKIRERFLGEHQAEQKSDSDFEDMTKRISIRADVTVQGGLHS